MILSIFANVAIARGQDAPNLTEIARILSGGRDRSIVRRSEQPDSNLARAIFCERGADGLRYCELTYDDQTSKLIGVQWERSRDRQSEWESPIRCDPNVVKQTANRIAQLGGYEGMFSWHSSWKEGLGGVNLYIHATPIINGIPLDIYQGEEIEAEYENGRIVMMYIGRPPQVSSDLTPAISASQAEFTSLEAFENTLPPRVISWINRGQLVHYLPRRPDYPYPGIPDLSHLREANQTVLAYVFRYEDFGYPEREGYRMTPMAIVDAHSGRLLNIFKPGYGALGVGTVKKGSSLAKLDISHETITIESAGKKTGSAIGSVASVGNGGKFRADKKVTLCYAKLSIPVEWDSKSGLVRMRTANGYAYGKPSKSVTELIRKS